MPPSIVRELHDDGAADARREVQRPQKAEMAIGFRANHCFSVAAVVSIAMVWCPCHLNELTFELCSGLQVYTGRRNRNVCANQLGVAPLGH